MLSNKMAFSLMSLITILAFAFVASTAMAGDPFGATISAVDVMEGGDIEVEYHASDQQEILISFGEVITNGELALTGSPAATDDIVITQIYRDGGTGATLGGAVTVGDPDNGKNFKVTLGSAIDFTQESTEEPNRPNATTPVKLHVLVKAKAVTKLGDPDTMNKVAVKTINLVRTDLG